jgi:hypothetical protein
MRHSSKYLRVLLIEEDLFRSTLLELIILPIPFTTTGMDV